MLDQPSIVFFVPLICLQLPAHCSCLPTTPDIGNLARFLLCARDSSTADDFLKIFAEPLGQGEYPRLPQPNHFGAQGLQIGL